MAEAAVGVAVGDQRVADGLVGLAVEQDGQPVALEHAGRAEHELLSGGEVDGHDATLRAIAVIS